MMFDWMREKKMSKRLVRNLAISAGLILVAFLAKMEAINFLIALWVAILVLVKVFKPLYTTHQRVGEKILDDVRPFPIALILSILWEMFSHQPFLLLWLLASGLSGWLTYSILTLLFIS